MSFQSRRQWEYGDPVEDAIAREARTDHHRATARARRLLLIADSLVRVLQVRGVLTDPDTARGDLFHALADQLYGNSPIDVPDFRDARSLEAMRDGRSA